MDRPVYKWWYDHIECRFYNGIIKYLSLFFGGEKKWRRRLIEPVEFAQNERILDMCCGTGGATFYISEKAGPLCHITAMDMSTGQLRYAEKRQYACPTEFINADATDAPFADASFDKVFIPHAIHEMHRADRLKTLRQARRLLKPTGRLIVLELDDPPQLWVRLLWGLIGCYWLPGNFETRTRRDMFRRGLTNEVAEAGFSDVNKHSYCRGVLQTVIATP